MSGVKNKKIKMKLWEKGYKLNRQVEEFTVGEDYILDQRLVMHDCVASIAHAKMLGKIGILKKKSFKNLSMNLKELSNLIRKASLRYLKSKKTAILQLKIT